MKVLSARFGNKENSLEGGVLIETDAIGSVSTSLIDAPYSGGAWEALQAWLGSGNTIAPYAEPIDNT